MEGYLNGELAIGIEESSGRIRLTWRGKSAARDPGLTLIPFFEGVVKEAGESGATVEMDFSGLEYFNSATLAAIIRSLQRSKRAGIQVVVAYDGAIGWQSRSCDALRVLEDAEGMLTLRDVRRAG